MEVARASLNAVLSFKGARIWRTYAQIKNQDNCRCSISRSVCVPRTLNKQTGHGSTKLDQGSLDKDGRRTNGLNELEDFSRHTKNSEIVGGRLFFVHCVAVCAALKIPDPKNIFQVRGRCAINKLKPSEP